jgi:hypothetical protein
VGEIKRVPCSRATDSRAYGVCIRINSLVLVPGTGTLFRAEDSGDRQWHSCLVGECAVPCPCEDEYRAQDSWCKRGGYGTKGG